MIDAPQTIHELRWATANNVTVGPPTEVMMFAQYDASKTVDLDRLTQNCIELSAQNAYVVLSELRDFALQDSDYMMIREHARVAGVPIVTWKENVTDPDTMQGNAIILSFANNTSTYTLPVSDSLFFCSENAWAIFRLAKARLFYERGARAEHDPRFDELNSILTDEFFSALTHANLERIFAGENKEEVYSAAETVSQRFDEHSGLIPLEISDTQHRNWYEDVQRIHDFLIQEIAEDHPIRTHEGYTLDRQFFYSLVNAYIRCPETPKEFIESVIQHRILPDLQRKDKIKKELIHAISDLGYRNHQQFFHVLAGSGQSREISYYLAASAKEFPTPQDAVEVMSELFTYSQEIDEHLFTVLWEEFRHDIGDSPGYDVKMIRSIGDAMVNRFGRLYTLDEQAMLIDSIMAELNDSMDTPRRKERVKAVTNRISYYAFRQSKEQLKNLHPNVVGTWFEWVTNQPEQAIEPWTIRFALGMPEEVVDNNQKSMFIDYLYKISLDSVGGLYMKDSKQVDVLLAENEVRVISSIMRDPTTPPEVRQMIETQFIRPVLRDFSLDAVNQTDVQEWDEQTYDRAKAIIDTLRSFIDGE